LGTSRAQPVLAAMAAATARSTSSAVPTMTKVRTDSWAGLMMSRVSLFASAVNSLAVK